MPEKDYDKVEFDEKKYRESIGKVWDAENDRLQDELSKTLVLSLMGNVDVGKSKLINAITGIKYADVSPVAGYTKNVSLFPLLSKTISLP